VMVIVQQHINAVVLCVHAEFNVLKLFLNQP